MVEAVEREFGTAVEPWLPKGGIFLWMKLPDQVDVRKLVQPALKAGIAFNPGPEWAVDGEAAKSRLRLCFGLTTKEEIREGVAGFRARSATSSSASPSRAAMSRATARGLLELTTIVASPAKAGIHLCRSSSCLNCGSRLSPGLQLDGSVEVMEMARAETQSQIDAALRRAVEAGEVPGVVAMAGNRGRASLSKARSGGAIVENGPAMTLGHRVPHRLDDQGDHLGRRDAARRGRQARARRAGARHRRAGAERAAGARRLRRGGAPILRPAQATDHVAASADPHRRVHLREAGTPNTLRYVEATGTPRCRPGRLAALRRPLAFDPGERWEYGINIDWVGRIVEEVSAAEARRRICASASSRRSAWAIPALCRPRSSGRGRRRCISASPTAASRRSRCRRRSMPEFFAGGGGLYSTGARLSALSRNAAARRQRSTARASCGRKRVALMNQNHIGDLPAGTSDERPTRPGPTMSISFRARRCAGGSATCST